jgi:hypothetical protein
MTRTLAPQQGHMAAGARPCNGLGLGYQWNATAPMTVSSMNPIEFVRDITAKRTARHLGGLPT